jgi:2-oxoglutarate dehydrogenase E2 component (dihydrolipoamide succinyltransferase)
MSIEIKVPAMGESVSEATVGRWLKSKGDAVAQDEPLVELETDKVAVEVPSPASGVLDDIQVAEGEAVTIGAVLGAVSARCWKAGREVRQPKRPRKRKR